MHPQFFRLLEVHRTLGLIRMLRIVPMWLVHRKFLVLIRDLHSPLPEIPRHQHLRWTILTEENVHRLQAINPTMSESEVRRRLMEGQECRLCWIGEGLVHYRWDTTQEAFLPYLGKTFRPLAGDHFATNVFTHPAFRGRGIFEVSSLAALLRARAQGCSRSVTVIAWWNTRSVSVNQQKAGRTIAGTIGYWNLGPGKRYFTTGDVCFEEDTSFFIHL